MNKYFVKHKRQTLEDFQMDCHRFSFWYDNRLHTASCFHAVSVYFSDETIPENVKLSVQDRIYHLIDSCESRWSVPKAAQAIADKYCADNFC